MTIPQNARLESRDLLALKREAEEASKAADERIRLCVEALRGDREAARALVAIAFDDVDNGELDTHGVRLIASALGMGWEWPAHLDGRVLRVTYGGWVVTVIDEPDGGVGWYAHDPSDTRGDGYGIWDCVDDVITTLTVVLAAVADDEARDDDCYLDGL